MTIKDPPVQDKSDFYRNQQYLQQEETIATKNNDSCNEFDAKSPHQEAVFEQYAADPVSSPLEKYTIKVHPV